MLDWMYGEARVPFAYSVHLGDTGTVRSTIDILYGLFK